MAQRSPTGKVPTTSQDPRVLTAVNAMGRLVDAGYDLDAARIESLLNQGRYDEACGMARSVAPLPAVRTIGADYDVVLNAIGILRDGCNLRDANYLQELLHRNRYEEAAAFARAVVGEPTPEPRTSRIVEGIAYLTERGRKVEAQEIESMAKAGRRDEAEATVNLLITADARRRYRAGLINAAADLLATEGRSAELIQMNSDDPDRALRWATEILERGGVLTPRSDIAVAVQAPQSAPTSSRTAVITTEPEVVPEAAPKESEAPTPKASVRKRVRDIRPENLMEFDPRVRALAAAPYLLTHAELRVVDALFARPTETNGNLGQSLFIAEGTVEGHLTRVFRKVGVKPRAALIDLLHRLGSEG